MLLQVNIDLDLNLKCLLLYSEDVKRLLAALTKEKGQMGLDGAYATYSSSWGSSPSKEAVKKTVVAIETDYLFLIPTQTTLYLHAGSAT